MLQCAQYKSDPLGSLQKLAPGYYTDSFGQEYFYLTEIYACLVQRLLDEPLINTPAFIADVLDELRGDLQERDCTELMD